MTYMAQTTAGNLSQMLATSAGLEAPSSFSPEVGPTSNAYINPQTGQPYSQAELLSQLGGDPNKVVSYPKGSDFLANWGPYLMLAPAAGMIGGAVAGGTGAAGAVGAGASTGAGADLTAAELYGSVPASYSLPASDLAAMGAGGTSAVATGASGLGTTVGGVPIEQAAAPVTNALGINYAGSALFPAPSNLATYLTGSPTVGNFFGSTNAAGLGGLGGGGMGEWSNLLNLGSGLYGMYLSNQQRQLAQQAAGMQDPFGPYRGQYATQLSQLMADPSKITTYPGYEAGLEGVNRGMAASGYLGSGNQMAALQKYAGDFYNNAVAQLGGLAGATFAPTGGSMLLQGNMNAANLASSSLGTLGYGAAMPQLYAMMLANRTGA